MTFTLVYLKPEGGEERFTIESNSSYRIGASSSNDIVLPQQDVSREHACLSVLETGFRIMDLNSKNGTFVNGNRTSAAEFGLGDYVNLSSARFFIFDEVSGEHADDFQERDISVFGCDVDSGNSTRALCRCFSTDDLIHLFGTVARAMEGQHNMHPLVWGVNRLNLKSGLVVSLGCEGNICVVSSAGDVGALLEKNLDIKGLSEHIRGTQEPSVQYLHEIDDDVLMGVLRDNHCLILRYESSPPAVGDVMILSAAINMVLLARKLQPPRNDRMIDLTSLKTKTLAEARQIFEDWMLGEVLRECQGNQSEAARRLGMTRAGLYKRLKKGGTHQNDMGCS